MSPARVAVIGAGPTGLMALKNLLEDGFDVTCYESRPYVGGLWRPSSDGGISALESTVFNTSSSRTAISDFPVGEEIDDFPTAPQLHQYLERYVEEFGLRKFIKLGQRVESMRRETGRWALDIVSSFASSSTPTNIQSRFDKVLVATGTFTKPKTPSLPGIELFAGDALHSVSFHDPASFDKKNILVVGFASTAHDTVVALSEHAKKVYVAHRRGSIMMSRSRSDGYPADAAATLGFTLWYDTLAHYFPNFTDWFLDWAVRYVAKSAFPDIPPEWQLSGSPHILIAPPSSVDEVMPHLRSGFAELVPAVHHVAGAKTVELTDGRVLEDLDAIIFCTGYELDVPIESPDFEPYPIKGQLGMLYRGVFPLSPDRNIRESLAYIGHSLTPLPGFVQYEILGMAVSQTWLGRSPLPAYNEMLRCHERHVKWRKNIIKRYGKEGPVTTTFLPILVPIYDHLRWLDETAGCGVFEHFGWSSRKAWDFWWEDRKFYNLCHGGLFSPSIFRLFETGKRKVWDGARQQVRVDNESAKVRAERARKAQEEEKKKKK